MGLSQTVEAVVTCPVCGESVLAEADLIAPFPLHDTPMELSVGQSLTPHQVSSYDGSFLSLRKRAEPERGRVITEWSCPVCIEQRWALVELGQLDGQASVVSVEARPIAPETLDEADWIHPSIVKELMRNHPSAVKLPDHGRLDEAQQRILANLLPKRSE